jgi:hypothetical protein
MGIGQLGHSSVLDSTSTCTTMASRNLILSDVRRTETYYFACGGLADLYKGQWTTQSGEILPVLIGQVIYSLQSNY